MTYSTQEIATLTGVTKRTLYHYETVGLLVPQRTATGHRCYSRENLLRLQQILLYRALDFPLSEIQTLLTQSDSNHQATLKNQIELLHEQAAHYRMLAQLAEQTLLTFKGGTPMKDEQLFRGLRHEEIVLHEQQHTEEVEQYYGDTDAYRINATRQQQRTPNEKEQLSTMHKQLDRRLTTLYRDGRVTTDPAVQQIVKEQHDFIDTHYYPCELSIFASLGQMYVSDERFRAYYEAYAPGLSSFYSKAISHYTQASH
ncbi:MerR family transcriptional regulator [Exiguobacterium sp. TDN 0502]|uniref:MerR family transcriptional regulator n=1 Tax=Exiguobacterium sp. TDN 0502 TaxID=3420731 RepID=UPI003D76E414